MRLCWGCDKRKPASEFYADQLKRSRPRCKECKRSYASKHYKQLKAERKCFHCREPLSESDVTVCALCKETNRGRYHSNGERYRANGRQRKRDLRLAAFEAYGGAFCACCEEGTYEFLSIDHIKGGGAAHRRQLKKKHGYVVDIYQWLKNNDYPKGFQVLCFNCNHAKGHYGSCPHEVERKRASIEAVK